MLKSWIWPKVGVSSETGHELTLCAILEQTKPWGDPFKLGQRFSLPSFFLQIYLLFWNRWPYNMRLGGSDALTKSPFYRRSNGMILFLTSQHKDCWVPWSLEHCLAIFYTLNSVPCLSGVRIPDSFFFLNLRGDLYQINIPRRIRPRAVFCTCSTKWPRVGVEMVCGPRDFIG